MTPRRRRLLTRGHVIAWVVSLVLGTGWVVLPGLLPGDLDPVTGLLLSLVGIFGSILGVLIATGTLVRVLGIFGARPGSLSPPAGELAPDLVFGLCVLLFSLPSLLAH